MSKWWPPCVKVGALNRSEANTAGTGDESLRTQWRPTKTNVARPEPRDKLRITVLVHFQGRTKACLLDALAQRETG